jgi:hypothetical protein
MSVNETRRNALCSWAAPPFGASSEAVPKRRAPSGLLFRKSLVSQKPEKTELRGGRGTKQPGIQCRRTGRLECTSGGMRSGRTISCC